MNFPGFRIVWIALCFCVLEISGWSDNPWDTPDDIPRLQSLDAKCLDSGSLAMQVYVTFDRPFNGIIFSQNYHSNPSCIFSHRPGSTVVSFNINYEECGTDMGNGPQPTLHGKPRRAVKNRMVENTIIIQFEEGLQQKWDLSRRLTCEWGNEYSIDVTAKPLMANLPQQLDEFDGNNARAWLEIQEGNGPTGRQANRVVQVGQIMTLVVIIRDPSGRFDARVKDCFGQGGNRPPVFLTDSHGCILRPTIMNPFQFSRLSNGDLAIYSVFQAFKFPDTTEVFIQCKVDMCQDRCPPIPPCLNQRFTIPTPNSQEFSSTFSLNRESQLTGFPFDFPQEPRYFDQNANENTLINKTSASSDSIKEAAKEFPIKKHLRHFTQSSQNKIKIHQQDETNLNESLGNDLQGDKMKNNSEDANRLLQRKRRGSLSDAVEVLKGYQVISSIDFASLMNEKFKVSSFIKETSNETCMSLVSFGISLALYLMAFIILFVVSLIMVFQLHNRKRKIVT